MKNLKLLNRICLSILLFTLFFGLATNSQEPVDIWNTENKKDIKDNNSSEDLEKKDTQQSTIYEMQSQKIDQLNIEQDQTLISKEIEIKGLYDPAQNGLNINMWSNSDGDQILSIFNRINKMDLSEDASEILEILLLTNAYYPEINISKEQFLKIKNQWLIKNSNFQLIENYILNNQIINQSPKLVEYLVDHYLSRSKVEKSCEILSKINENIEDEYLSKFKIYCLVNDNKKEDAQLLLDLKKEIGFEDKFYENKINFLMGYLEEPQTVISEKTLLDFHLSHRTNPCLLYTSPSPRD